MNGDRADMRISDAEREDALDVLGEHVRTGRLDIEEFGSRSAKVNIAKTVRELAPLFADLPSPRPGVLIAHAVDEPSRSGEQRLPTRWLNAGAVPIAAVIAFGVLMLTRAWPVAVGVALITLLLLMTRRR